MSRHTQRRVLALLAGLALALGFAPRPSQPVRAQGAGYAIDWYSIDGGSVTASPAPSGYSLSGTIGQTDVETHAGGSFVIRAGFWGGIDPRFLGNLPWVER